MKKFIVFAVLTLVSLLCFVPVYGEEVSLGGADDSVEVGGAEGEMGSELPEEIEGEKAERFEEIMTELYGYWMDYTEIEGDNAFEKFVNMTWKYRGDIGGVAAAIAVIVFLCVMGFRYMPKLSEYFKYIYQGGNENKDAILQGMNAKIEEYAPALEVVALVAAMYPKMEAAFCEFSEKQAALSEKIDAVGARVEETERAHAAEMKLQGETFKDIISLSALPVGKKNEILEKYRVIESGEPADEGATE